LDAFLIRFVYKTKLTFADNKYYYPSKETIKRLVPIMFQEMEKSGYSKSDYRAEVHDCDDYALAGMVKLHDLLIKDVPNAKGAFPIFAFSFGRVNGKRHRLFFIVDNKGNRHYVESYPVFDKYHDKSGMYRILTTKEELNGYIIG
jgi:hypothetical protein